MTTEKQTAANRQNAQFSTGPRTEEGKRTSSLNARRHGLTGQVSAMTDEDRAAHDAFSAAMLKDLAPEGALEIQLAQRIATDSWRLNRISAIEDNLFALGFSERAAEIETEHPEVHAALTAARTFQAEAKQLQLLTLYEQRLNRAVQKNLAMLQELQAARKARRRTAMDEARKLHQLSLKKNLRYQGVSRTGDSPLCGDINVDGFVFSTAQIHAAIDRDRRLERAKLIDFHSRKSRKFQARAA